MLEDKMMVKKYMIPAFVKFTIWYSDTFEWKDKTRGLKETDKLIFRP